MSVTNALLLLTKVERSPWKPLSFLFHRNSFYIDVLHNLKSWQWLVCYRKSPSSSLPRLFIITCSMRSLKLTLKLTKIPNLHFLPKSSFSTGLHRSLWCAESYVLCLIPLLWMTCIIKGRHITAHRHTFWK